MPEQQSRKTIALNQDFIMVWDNVVPGAFCDWLIDYLEQTESLWLEQQKTGHLDKQVEMHNFSPGEADYLQDIVNQCCFKLCSKLSIFKKSNSPSLVVVSC